MPSAGQIINVADFTTTDGGAKVATQIFGANVAHTLNPGDTYEVGLLPTALTIPFDGVVLTRVVLQAKQTTASYTRLEMSGAGGGLAVGGGASWVWELESTFHGLRGELVGEFYAVVTAGSWVPSVNVLCHSDSSDDVFLDQVAGVHLLTDNYSGFT